MSERDNRLFGPDCFRILAAACSSNRRGAARVVAVKSVLRNCESPSGLARHLPKWLMAIGAHTLTKEWSPPIPSRQNRRDLGRGDGIARRLRKAGAYGAPLYQPIRFLRVSDH